MLRAIDEEVVTTRSSSSLVMEALLIAGAELLFSVALNSRGTKQHLAIAGIVGLGVYAVLR